MAGDESKTATSICSYCQKPSARRCEGCNGAPSYDGSSPQPTFYCDTRCQKADWSKHKPECKKLQVRKTLERAASILKAIMYQIQLKASPLYSQSLCVQGSTIYLEGFVCDGGPERCGYLGPFPVASNGDQRIFEAAMMWMTCPDAMLYLRRFATKFLPEQGSKVEEANIIVTKSEFRICPVLPNGNKNILRQQLPVRHHLYRVTLNNGEVWALDPTGAQYGYVKPLFPWHDLGPSTSVENTRVYPLGTARLRDFQETGRAFAENVVLGLVDRFELSEALNKAIPELIQENGGDLRALLKGSDAVFTQAKNRFLKTFDDHLDVAMIKLYMPEQVKKRNKKILRQLSQKTTPDGVKDVLELPSRLQR